MGTATHLRGGTSYEETFKTTCRFLAASYTTHQGFTSFLSKAHAQPRDDSCFLQPSLQGVVLQDIGECGGIPVGWVQFKNASTRSFKKKGRRACSLCGVNRGNLSLSSFMGGGSAVARQGCWSCLRCERGGCAEISGTGNDALMWGSVDQYPSVLPHVQRATRYMSKCFLCVRSMIR